MSDVAERVNDDKAALALAVVQILGPQLTAACLQRRCNDSRVPDEEKARVLWAGLDGYVPRLIELQARLVAVHRGAGFEVGSKKFRPQLLYPGILTARITPG